MDITFTKKDLRSYFSTALRADGVTVVVPGYDRKFLLPHDLAHYLIERGLGLRRGFWGCVAAGALFPGMTVVSGRQRHDAKARSKAVLKEAGQQGTEAEVYVSTVLKIMHDGLDDHWPVARALLEDVWKPSKPSRGLPDAEEVRAICKALREAQTQWQALPVGESMTVTWPFAGT